MFDKPYKKLFFSLCLMFFTTISISSSLAEANGEGNKSFVVVLDPGHGGIDSGAVGTNGTLEKHVTLSFAKNLESKLKKHSHIKVFLTRQSDVFVNLTDRMITGRNLGADLFISIHADSIDSPSVRGTTIYSSSSKHSDVMSEKLSHSQNQAGLLLGIQPSYSSAVPNILLDFTRRESKQKANLFSELAITYLDGKIQLNTNPIRQANFHVLSAPDFPSVLIELGYLSNKHDENLLKDEEWMDKIANLLAESIVLFAN